MNTPINIHVCRYLGSGFDTKGAEVWLFKICFSNYKRTDVRPTLYLIPSVVERQWIYLKGEDFSFNEKSYYILCAEDGGFLYVGMELPHFKNIGLESNSKQSEG